MSQGKTPPLIFPDTNALLSLILFPVDRAGALTLAGEVKALYEQGAFELMISQVVADELLEVIGERFSAYRELVEQFLKPFESRFTHWPTQEEVKAALPYVVDREDAPVFAAAALSQPDIVLSNDFETFHVEKAKEFWKEHGIQIESLYGLLCVFGKRERKDDASSEGSSGGKGLR